MTLRHRLTRAALSAATAAALATHAAAPNVIVLDVDATFPSVFLTAACGFPVYRHDVGTVRVQLFERAGTTEVRELDTFANYRVTIFSPTEEGGTGGSSTSPAPAPLFSTYPEGVFVGAPATLVLAGLQLQAPGSPQAGRQVYSGEIVFIDEMGVPFTDVVEELDADGHFLSTAEFVAARCASLQAP